MGNKSVPCGSVLLYAHAASLTNNSSNPNNAISDIWNSGEAGTDAGGNAIKFNVPTIANGRVYVGTEGNTNPRPTPPTGSFAGELDIYGLKH